MCHNLITSEELDFFIITETWLTQEDCSALIEATPPEFTFMHRPRLSGRGGGVAVIYKKHFKCTPIPHQAVQSFEYLGLIINSKTPILVLVIYRPPKPSPMFIEEFSELLSLFTPKFDNILVLGDFNIHVCCPSQAMAAEFMDTLESLNLRQAIEEPTHCRGHILDLVIHSGVNPTNVVVKDTGVSDHKAVLFNITTKPLDKTQNPAKQVRSFNSESAKKFSEILALPAPSATNLRTDELVSRFNNACLMALDTVAPFRIKKQKPTLQPWINNQTNKLKRDYRKAERKWKKSGLEVFRQIWKESLKNYQLTVKQAKQSYYSNLITSNCSNPRVLFQVLDSIMTPTSTPVLEGSAELCNKLMTFFVSKVVKIREQ